MRKVGRLTALALLVVAGLCNAAQAVVPISWSNFNGRFNIDFQTRTWSVERDGQVLSGTLFEVTDFGGALIFNGSGEANVIGFLAGTTGRVTIESNSLGRFTITGSTKKEPGGDSR